MAEKFKMDTGKLYAQILFVNECLLLVKTVT